MPFTALPLLEARTKMSDGDVGLARSVQMECTPMLRRQGPFSLAGRSAILLALRGCSKATTAFAAYPLCLRKLNTRARSRLRRDQISTNAPSEVVALSHSQIPAKPRRATTLRSSQLAFDTRQP
jgi:hypothetical protein